MLNIDYFAKQYIIVIGLQKNAALHIVGAIDLCSCNSNYANLDA